jgi:hypothetical protein
MPGKNELLNFELLFPTKTVIFGLHLRSVGTLCQTNLPVISYTCETWSLALTQENESNENKSLKKITGQLGNLSRLSRNKKLSIIYHLVFLSQVGYVARMETQGINIEICGEISSKTSTWMTNKKTGDNIMTQFKERVALVSV